MAQHLVGRSVGAVLVGLTLAACTPSVSTRTQLEITTIETICGGAFNPDLPPCHSSAVSRRIEVVRNREVVAAAITDASGYATVDVPAADLVVSASDAPSYMDCDAPAVAAIAGTTTPVTQTCVVSLP